MNATGFWTFIAALVIPIFLCTLSASAQSIWTSQISESSVGVEWLRPSMSGGGETTFFTSSLFLSGRVGVSSQLQVVGDLPISHFGLDADFVEASETAVGNPYVGIAWAALGGPTTWEVGMRLPLASSDNLGLFTGFIADVDRMEAFTADVFSLLVHGNYWYRNASGFGMRLRGGPSVQVYTGGEDFADDAELLLNYSAQGLYEAGTRVQISAGATGRMIVSEKDINLAERSFHQLGAGVVSNFGRFHPGIHLRIPIDTELNDIYDFVVGINVIMSLR